MDFASFGVEDLKEFSRTNPPVNPLTDKRLTAWLLHGRSSVWCRWVFPGETIQDPAYSVLIIDFVRRYKGVDRMIPGLEWDLFPSSAWISDSIASASQHTNKIRPFCLDPGWLYVWLPPLTSHRKSLQKHQAHIRHSQKLARLGANMGGKE